MIGAILFMGLLIVSSGTDTPDSALEQREAEEGAAVEAQRDPQPEPEPEPEPEPVGLEFSGTGPQATEQFDLSAGLARFEKTHQGESNFIVNLLDDEGGRGRFVAEEPDRPPRQLAGVTNPRRRNVPAERGRRRSLDDQGAAVGPKPRRSVTRIPNTQGAGAFALRPSTLRRLLCNCSDQEIGKMA